MVKLIELGIKNIDYDGFIDYPNETEWNENEDLWQDCQEIEYPSEWERQGIINQKVKG